MSFLIRFAWRDLRASGHSLWVFCVCLLLGVTLVAATGGLYRQVSEALFDDTRALLGGDLEVESRAPLPEDTLAWMRARGTVSLLTEVRTLMGTADGAVQLVELQSVDEHYPRLALITSLFAIVMGSAIALPLLALRLKLPVEASLMLGAGVALGVSGLCLYLGGRYLLQRLRLNPAMLLRSGG